jgi:hypothetical protein
MKRTGSPFPLACDRGALSPQQRQAHEKLTARLFRSSQAVRELPNGLGLRFSNDPSVLKQIVSFIANEQRCCPFLEFDVRVEPRKERLQLSLTGGRHVKSFLRLEFADLLKS